MALSHEHEQLRQRWHRERRIDKRITKVFATLITICTAGMVLSPADQWRWWFMGGAITLVVVVSIITFTWIYPRHMRRLREINELESEALRDLAQRN